MESAERKAPARPKTAQFVELTRKDWILIVCIPFIAIGVAGRQAYLNAHYELSTWKGGGMGMFADVDASSRFMKIYMELPNGQRHPISKLTALQQRLQSGALYYPTENNFRILASSIRKTNWVSPDQLTPLLLWTPRANEFAPVASPIICSIPSDNGTKVMIPIGPSH